MRYLLIMTFFTLSALSFAPIQAQAQNGAENPAIGYWLVENKRAVIHLEKCEKTKLCGTIHWIIKDGMTKDEKNPNPVHRNRPLCGKKILWDFEADGENWKDGKIYKADEGDTYDAKITKNNDGTLTVRGFVGISLFGKSQKWTRVSPDAYPKCK